jgi:hypothetical protein
VKTEGCLADSGVIENYWVSGLCISRGIINNCKTRHIGNWSCSRLQVRGRRHSDGSIRADLNHWLWSRLQAREGATVSVGFLRTT